MRLQMLDKDLFIKLLVAAQKIYETMDKLQQVLEFNWDSGPLPDAFDVIMAALCEETEIHTDEGDIGPIVYYYAFQQNWGKKGPFELSVDPSNNHLSKITISDASSLYDYLRLKFEYDKEHYIE